MILSVSLTVPLLALAQSISDYSPVAHWTCDEDSGVRYDSTSNSNDLTDVNTVGTTTGKLGNACDFELSNTEYFTIADANTTGLDVDSHCINQWIKVESFTHNAVLSGKRDPSTGQGYGTLILLSPKHPIGSVTDTGSLTSRADGATTFSTATWYMMTTSYNSSDSSFDVWVDGVADTPYGLDVANATNVDSEGRNFVMGGNGSGGNLFDGAIDEISIFPSTCDQTMVTALYNSGTPLPFELSTETPTTTVLTFASMLLMPEFTTCAISGATTTCSYTYGTSSNEVVDALGITALSGVAALAVLVMALSFAYVIWIMRA